MRGTSNKLSQQRNVTILTWIAENVTISIYLPWSVSLCWTRLISILNKNLDFWHLARGSSKEFSRPRNIKSINNTSSKKIFYIRFYFYGMTRYELVVLFFVFHYKSYFGLEDWSVLSHGTGKVKVNISRVPIILQFYRNKVTCQVKY